MVNASIDAIRKRNRGPMASDEDFLFDTAESMDEGVVDDYLIKLKAEKAIKAIQLLSPAYRTVFNLFVIENYSHAEIAEILSISEGTSKSNLAKAKQNLKQNFSKFILKYKNSLL